MAFWRKVAMPLLLWAALSSAHQKPGDANEKKIARHDKQQSQLGIDAVGQLFDNQANFVEVTDKVHIRSHATNASAQGHHVKFQDHSGGGALIGLAPGEDPPPKAVGPSSRGEPKPEDECGACGESGEDRKECKAQLVKKDDKFSDCPMDKPQPGYGWQPVFAIQTGNTGKFTVTIYDKDNEGTKWPGEEEPTNCYISSAMLAESEGKIVCVSIGCVETDSKCNVEFSFDWVEADVRDTKKGLAVLHIVIIVVVCLLICPCFLGVLCCKESYDQTCNSWASTIPCIAWCGYGQPSYGAGQWSGEGEWGGAGGGGYGGGGGEWGGGGGYGPGGGGEW